MDATDAALIKAWELFLEDCSEQVQAELEALLPTLLHAGYAEADEYTWRFTPHGVARAESLTADDSQ